MKRADLDTLTVLHTVAEHRLDAVAALLERQPRKIVLAALMREVGAGRLDYGVSINYPWLTPKGKRYLLDAADKETAA